MKALGFEPYAYLHRVFSLIPTAATVADIEALLTLGTQSHRLNRMCLPIINTSLQFDLICQLTHRDEVGGTVNSAPEYRLLHERGTHGREP